MYSVKNSVQVYSAGKVYSVGTVYKSTVQVKCRGTSVQRSVQYSPVVRTGITVHLSDTGLSLSSAGYCTQ